MKLDPTLDAETLRRFANQLRAIAANCTDGSAGLRLRALADEIEGHIAAMTAVEKDRANGWTDDA